MNKWITTQHYTTIKKVEARGQLLLTNRFISEMDITRINVKQMKRARSGMRSSRFSTK